MSTFITKALCLVGDVQLLNCHLLLNEWLILRYLSLLWLEFTTRFVTKATPINLTFINYLMPESLVFSCAKILFLVSLLFVAVKDRSLLTF